MMHITCKEKIEPSRTLCLVASIYICTVQDFHWITRQIFRLQTSMELCLLATGHNFVRKIESLLIRSSLKRGLSVLMM